MSSIGTKPASEPRREDLGGKFNRFWRRVTDGLELNQLWNQFQADARASYRLYSKDVRPAETRPGAKGHHWFEVARQFFWAILEKLSPARRVLLLLALVLIIISPHVAWQGQGGENHVVDLDFQFWGGLLMFVLLILEVGDRVVMKRDLQIAREIQMWLLPGSPPAVPGLELAFATRPANTVAGDFYDVFRRFPAGPGQETYLIAVADVAGKSIPAALLMATFQASLKTLSSTPSSLDQLIAGMNRYACSNSQSGLRFITAFIAEYDPEGRTLTYINAGHNLPILRRTSGAIERLEAGGLPLGIQDAPTYQSGIVTLQSGDYLVIFTDGLVEAVNQRDEEYGEERMLAVLNQAASDPPSKLLSRIMVDVDFFVGNAPQHDDVTCVLLKVS